MKHTISLAMASVQSVANLIVVASSLATDGPEETLSCLIHMAKLQDPSNTLDKEAFDLLHGVSELKRDVILSSMLTHASEVLDTLMMEEKMQRNLEKADDRDTKKMGSVGTRTMKMAMTMEMIMEMAAVARSYGVFGNLLRIFLKNI